LKSVSCPWLICVTFRPLQVWICIIDFSPALWHLGQLDTDMTSLEIVRIECARFEGHVISNFNSQSAWKRRYLRKKASDQMRKVISSFHNEE
jgi:hypothetical protein